MSSKEKQDQRKAEMQAAAERDGFETWSQALTAWKNGTARLTKVAVNWRVRKRKSRIHRLQVAQAAKAAIGTT